MCIPWALDMRHTVMTKRDEESEGPLRKLLGIFRSGMTFQSLGFTEHFGTAAVVLLTTFPPFYLEYVLELPDPIGTYNKVIIASKVFN